MKKSSNLFGCINKDDKELSNIIIKYISSKTKDYKLEFAYFANAIIHIYNHYGWEKKDNPIHNITEVMDQRITDQIMEQRLQNFRECLALIRKGEL